MHILLVEDHSNYLEQVVTILQKRCIGIESLRTATSVEEAMILIEADHPLDLLITDTQIKNGSCIDVLCRVYKFDYDVVFMSTDERDFRVKSMIAAGFPFYCKLDDIQKLVVLIQIQIANRERSTAQKIKKLKGIIKIM